MFDDLFGLEDADYLDCVLKAHTAKEEAKTMGEEELVDHILQHSYHLELDMETDKVISKFFKLGKLDKRSRQALEDYYVLFNTTYFLGDDGEIYATMKK